jgi:colicin import membrane protein
MIKKIKLPKIAKKHPIAFWTAIILHIALVIGIVFSNTQRWEIPQQDAKPITKPNVKLISVDTVSIVEIAKERQRIVENKKKRLANEQKHLSDLKRAENKIEKERYKEQQALKRLKSEIKKEKQAKLKAKKDRKIAEKEIKKTLKKKKLEEKKTREAKKKTKAEEKKANEAKKKTKLEEKKTREAKKKTKAEEKKAKLAEQEKNKIERLIRLEAKRFEKEQGSRSLKKELQAEEDQEREIAQEDILNGLKLSYINQIASRVKDHWRPSFGAKDNWSCSVDITQGLDGKVLSVNVHSCNVSDSSKAKVFMDSIERAVNKASPLPVAPDKGVFDKEIKFHFRVN